MEKIMLYKFLRWNDKKYTFLDVLNRISLQIKVWTTGIILTLCVNLLLLFSGLNALFMLVPMVVELICILGLNNVIKKENIVRSTIKLSEFKKSCKELKLWLEVNDFKTKNQIKQLVTRCRQAADDNDRLWKCPAAVMRKGIYSLIIPIGLSVYALLFAANPVLLTKINLFSTIVMFLVTVDIGICGTTNLMTILFKRDADKMRDFIDELNGVLDLCFEVEDEDISSNEARTRMIVEHE